MVNSKGKSQRHSTYLVPQGAYYSYRDNIQPGLQPKLTLTDFGLQPHIALSLS